MSPSADAPMEDPVPAVPRATHLDPVDVALVGARRVAVVGLSDDPSRDSHGVARSLLAAGYEVVPVNPTLDEVLGLRAWPDLASVPGRIDLVDVFRRPEHLPAVAAEAVAREDVAVVWNQLGLRSDEAAAIVADAGRVYVEDRCLKVEVLSRRARPPAGPRIEHDLVLLDLDDTLLDHDGSERAAVRATLTGAGLPDDEEAVDTYVAINAAAWREYREGRIDPSALRIVRWERTLEALGGRVAGSVDVRRVAAEYLEAFGSTAVLLPGAAEATWWLTRRSRVAIATNGFADTQATRTAAARLDGLLPVLASSEQAGVAKPDPAVLRLALDGLDVALAPGEMLGEHHPDVAVVGDQVATDVAAGAAIGATTVWIAPDDAVVPADVPAPDHRVPRLADLA